MDIIAGTTWEKEDSLLQIEANGTPTTFNVAEFSIDNLNLKRAFETPVDDLGFLLRKEGYTKSNKKLCLI